MQQVQSKQTERLVVRAYEARVKQWFDRLSGKIEKFRN